MKIIVVTTIKEHQQITYRDVLEADIVIVSCQLFQNKKYNKAVGTRAASYMDWRIRGIERNIEWFSNGQMTLDNKGPIFGAFNWRRLVLDEGHELFSETQMKASACIFSILQCIHSNYRWYVSGTPFPDPFFSVRGALRFIGICIEAQSRIDHGLEDRVVLAWSKRCGKPAHQHPSSILSSPLGAFIHERLFGDLFCRYTRQDVKAAFEIPMYEMKTEIFQMHPIERYFYGLHDQEKECVLPDAALVWHNFDFPQTISDLLSVEGGVVPRARKLRQASAHPLAGRLGDVLLNRRPRKLLRELRQSWVRPGGFSRDPFIVGRENKKQVLSLTWALEEFAKCKRDVLVDVLELADQKRSRCNSLRKFCTQMHYTAWFGDTPRGYDETKAKKKFREDEEEAKALSLEVDRLVEYASVSLMPIFYHTLSLTKPELRSQLSAEVSALYSSLSRSGGNVDYSIPCYTPPRAPPFYITKGEQSESPAEDLVLRHGTKVAYVLDILDRILKNEIARVLIFSQWERILGGLRDALEGRSIDFVTCKGNVLKRNGAMKRFANDKNVRVMMLSLDNAASGANLQSASHLILMEPILGSKEEVQATRAQAIGRAYRQGQTKQLEVIRLVMAGTSEHETLIKNEGFPSHAAKCASSSRGCLCHQQINW
uniref:Helicase C-terminal domain-containing protein n=1 Tax=Lotharella globosa TaxID=91324 RepID=A0A7S3ZA03_9EUKA|mmetsp:Transcript_4793/g.9335  ORF Transcript_4793/g.9335 Transcript_4793/m.9335 type:complete len:655 (+) Transcript_4793:1044-3008(+)